MALLSVGGRRSGRVLPSSLASLSLAQQPQRRNKHFKVLVVGGGPGGLSVASSMAKENPKGSVSRRCPVCTHTHTHTHT